MKALCIQLNGGSKVTAGLSDPDVVTVVASSAMRDPRHQSPDEPQVDLSLQVVGLRRTDDGIQSSVEWLEQRLKVNDQLVIRVVDVDEADLSLPTKERTVADVTESAERKQLVYLIRKYGVP